MTTRHSNKGLVLAVLLAAPFMAQADATITNVATPSIHADLGATSAQLELVIGAYVIAFAVLLIPGARLGQTHGYRRVFTGGMGTFALASLVCGLAPDPIVVIAGRAIQGAGAALMFPQTLTGIQLHFQPTQRPRAIGLYAIALSAGAVIGQVLGGVLVSANLAGEHWRSVFLVNVPIAAAVIAAAVCLLPVDERLGSRRVDLRGVALLSVTVLLIVVPLALGRSQGWPAWTWACLAAGPGAAALFISAQRSVASRGGAPLVNVSALQTTAIGWGLLSVATATGTYYGLLFTVAQYLQRGLGRGALTSGLTLVPWVAAFGLAGQIVRRLPDRQLRLAAPVGCVVLGASYLLLAVTALAGSDSEPVLLAILAGGGLGLGIQFSAMIAHLTNAVESSYAPDISGVSTTTMQIAGAIGVAAFGTLYAALASSPGAGEAHHAFGVIALAFAGAALAAALSAHRSTRSPRSAADAPRSVADSPRFVQTSPQGELTARRSAA